MRETPIRTINSAAPIRICDNGGWTDTWFAGHGQIFNIAVAPCAEVQIAVYPRAARPAPVLLHAENYGERMAQHWLDVTRYADSSGFANDFERGNAWRYRDYVVRAFNADKPYDRFVREQIAGDEIDPQDPELIVATGFLRMGPWELTGMEVAKIARQRFLDDVTNSVGETFLAHSLQCARCHDHKFDPVPTRDYYSLHGVFASTEEPAERPLLGPIVETPEYRRFLEKTAEAEEKVKERARSEVEKFLGEIRAKTGDYLLGAHDLAAAGKEVKLDLFAGPRKLNVEFLKRWRDHLASGAAKNDPVLAPWIALSALPAEGFADAARGVLLAGANFDPVVVAAFTGSGATLIGHSPHRRPPSACGTPAASRSERAPWRCACGPPCRASRRVARRA